MYENKVKNDIYKELKELLKDTEVAKCFNDDYPFVYIDCFEYIEQEGELPDAVFMSVRTGYNTDQVITFVKDSDGIFTKSYYRKNYGGYVCRCDGKQIRETINYGFGSNVVNVYDLHFNLLECKKEQSYGCCCG